jgi:hypothetical protein
VGLFADIDGSSADTEISRVQGGRRKLVVLVGLYLLREDTWRSDSVMPLEMKTGKLCMTYGWALQEQDADYH